MSRITRADARRLLGVLCFCGAAAFTFAWAGLEWPMWMAVVPVVLVGLGIYLTSERE